MQDLNQHLSTKTKSKNKAQTTFWKPLSPNFLKTNCDVRWDEGSENSSLGVVVRNETGVVTFVWAIKASLVASPHLAELLALKEEDKVAFQCGMTNVIMESDSLVAIKKL